MHKFYVSNFSPNSPESPVILKLQFEYEGNIFEHNAISAKLLLNHSVNLVSVFLSEALFEDLSLEESSGKLFFKGREVAAVYFRSGYNEKEYSSSDCQLFRFREITEKSLAINLPSLKLQILSMKIVQKFLLMDDFLEKIKMKPEDVRNIRKYTTDILNIKLDCNSSKKQLISKIENNLDE